MIIRRSIRVFLTILKLYLECIWDIRYYASFNFTFIDNLITIKIFIIIKGESLHKVKNYVCISFIRPFLLGIWNKCKGKLKQNMVPLSIVKLLFRVNREKIYDIDVIL